MALKAVALAGGVGGAKLVDGLAQVLSPEDLTVIVNTGDDFKHLGLHISPDLDTVIYTLAAVENPEQGWGRAEETWNALETLERYGGPAWFRLGDKDLGLHLYRTHRMQAGDGLTAITEDVRGALDIQVRVLPMSDQRVSTIVETPEGPLPFQTYFVARRCQPRAVRFHFQGAEQAEPAPGVAEALDEAEVIIFCPSNPWVSLDPILSVPGIRTAVEDRPTIAVSPIIGGKALKGPAAKMFEERGIEPSALAVAAHYKSLLTGFVFDEVDESQGERIAALGIVPLARQTIMKNRTDRKRLAEEVVAFASDLKVGVSG